MTRFNGRSDFNMPMGGSCEPSEEEIICPDCRGLGDTEGDDEHAPEVCKRCNGSGLITVTKED